MPIASQFELFDRLAGRPGRSARRVPARNCVNGVFFTFATTGVYFINFTLWASCILENDI